VREEIRQPSPAPAPAPRVEQPPRVNPKEILQDAGLVMIETDRSKAPVQAQFESDEAAHLGRPRRERPKPENEELQQVETKR
jgi:hypothetical protein